MSTKESRKGLSEPIFFILFIVSPVVSVGIIVWAFLSNSFLAIALALPYCIVSPIWSYIDARVTRQLMREGAKLVVMLIISFITIFLLTSFGPFWMPQFLLASITFVSTAMFLVVLSSLLCERFLKPKLALSDSNNSEQIQTETHRSI